MAPPTYRRSGYSRRAQYSLFAAYLIAMTGVVGGVLLLIIAVIDPSGFSALRGLAAEVTAPVTRSANALRRTTRDAFYDISAYWDAGSKNAALERELKARRIESIRARAITQENIRLRKLLNLVEKTPERVAVGRIMSSSGASTRRFATLSVGANRNVERGQPVRAPEGLIGRVLEVGPTTSRILLITDTDTVVPVRRISDSLPAFASGLADGTLLVKPINSGNSQFKPGEIIITSGNGGLYAPNIPVAVVIGETRDGAIARPLADPAKVAFVMVEPVFERVIQPEVIPADSVETPDAGDDAAASDD